MIKRENDYYKQVSDLMSQAEFENRMKKFKKKFSRLINDDVIAYLIIDELGRNFTVFNKFSELKPGTKASLYATVTAPEPKLFLKRKDNLYAAEVFIADSSGKARLILWDTQHVNLIENKTIKPGTKLKILNAKISKSSIGLDISPDRFEALIINPENFPDSNEIQSDDGINISDIADVIDEVFKND